MLENTFNNIFPPLSTPRFVRNLRKCGLNFCKYCNNISYRYYSHRSLCGKYVPPADGKTPELSAKYVYQLADRLVEIAVFLCKAIDLFVRVHNGRVMLAAELAPDLRVAAFREPFAQIHRDLPRRCDSPRIVL